MARPVSQPERRVSDTMLRAAYRRGTWSVERERELQQVQRSIATVGNRVRETLDIGRIVIAGLATGALIMLLAFTAVYLLTAQLSVAMLFTAFSLVSVPVAVVLTFRAVRPWLLVKSEANRLRDRADELQERRENALFGRPENQPETQMRPGIDASAVASADQVGAITDAVAAQSRAATSAYLSVTEENTTRPPTVITGILAKVKKSSKESTKKSSSQAVVTEQNGKAAKRSKKLKKAEAEISGGLAGKRLQEFPSRRTLLPNMSNGIMVFGMLAIIALVLMLFATGVILGVMSGHG